MRLWHQSLIALLPRQQLLGQHREACALRGHGWGKPHATVNYVFSYSPYKLYQYHSLIMAEMQSRGYRPDPVWQDSLYRGKACPPYTKLEPIPLSSPIYPDHDQAYLEDCISNLKAKGIDIDWEGLLLGEKE